MLEGFTELQLLISALPSDFARVEERFAEIRGEILASFRAEDRPAGEVIDAYLARADALMTATPEGRAFEGAFALLRDDAMVAQLREDLTPCWTTRSPTGCSPTPTGSSCAARCG